MTQTTHHPDDHPNQTDDQSETIVSSKTDKSQDSHDAKPAISHAKHAELLALLNETEQKLNDAEATIADQKDQVLRAYAESENLEKRTEKEIQKVRKYALEKICLDLLDVIDNLERAIDSKVEADSIAAKMQTGVEMTLKLFLDVLKRHQVEVICPLNLAFDPNLHQAISAKACKDHEPNIVLEVLQKGYKLQDRLIRPALVIVSK